MIAILILITCLFIETRAYVIVCFDRTKYKKDLVHKEREIKLLRQVIKISASLEHDKNNTKH